MTAAQLETLWAGWRAAYIAGETGSNVANPHSPQGTGESIFETLVNSSQPDDQTLIVWRGQSCYAVLNLFPYCTGHLLVLPNRAVSELAELTSEESAELWEGVNLAVAAIEQAYHPEGVNVGMNLGRAAGAGIPGHLHVHCLPRWSGDTNFMTAISHTRVIPEELTKTWAKLREAWPAELSRSAS